MWLCVCVCVLLLAACLCFVCLLLSSHRMTVIHESTRKNGTLLIIYLLLIITTGVDGWLDRCLACWMDRSMDRGGED